MVKHAFSTVVHISGAAFQWVINPIHATAPVGLGFSTDEEDQYIEMTSNHPQTAVLIQDCGWILAWCGEVLTNWAESCGHFAPFCYLSVWSGVFCHCLAENKIQVQSEHSGWLEWQYPTCNTTLKSYTQLNRFTAAIIIILTHPNNCDFIASIICSPFFRLRNGGHWWKKHRWKKSYSLKCY